MSLDLEVYQIITLNDFIAGTIAGWFQVLVGQPFELIKVRLQAQSYSSPYYKNPIDCFKKIIKDEGIRTFYKGALSPIVGNGICFSIMFGANEALKRLLIHYHKSRNTNYDGFLSYTELAICGSLAGMASAIASTPIEHIRIKVQMSGTELIKKEYYKNTTLATKHIIAKYGIKGLYKGGVPTVYREGISYFFYFGLYESLMQNAEKIHGSREQIPSWKIIFFSSLLGFGEWIPCFPFDVIKSRIQSDNLANNKYKNMRHCARLIYQKSGIKGFFQGLTPCLLKAPPVNIATFLAFEYTLRFLNNKKE